MQTSTEIPCIKCGEPQTVPLSQGVIDRFKATIPRMRPNIQTVFPKLSPDQREMLKSELCGKCWEKIFAEPSLPSKPGQFAIDADGRPCVVVADEPRRPHHAQASGHSDGEEDRDR